MDPSSSWEIEKNLTETELLLKKNLTESDKLLFDHPSDINCTGLSDFAASSMLRELTFQDGQIAMHGLRRSILPRYTWEMSASTGTLEEIVNQATEPSPLKSPTGNNDEFLKWLSPLEDTIATIGPVDAMVPSSTHISAFATGSAFEDTHDNASFDHQKERQVKEIERCTSINESVSFSETLGKDNSKYTEEDSPKMETLGKDNSRYTEEDSPKMEVGIDLTSTSHTFDTRRRKQAKTHDDKSGQNEKSSISTRRSKAAAIHNQSERKRRDKINQRMNTLQKLVPCSNKTDKASMLDEVIEYVKSLKMQINMMNGASMAPAMMMPIPLQQLHMSMMAQMRMHGLGMSMGALDMNTMGHPNMAGIPPVMNPATFMHMPSWNASNEYLASSTTGMVPDPRAAFLACQTQQPMTMDAYGRMVPLYQPQQPQQQQQQQQIPTTKS